MNLSLKTNRLYLRLPQEEDVDELFKLMSNTELTRFLSWEAHKDRHSTTVVLNSLIESQKNDKGYHWCICIEDKIIGIVSLFDVKRVIRTWTLNRAELAYWITPNFQGKGYITEACEAILKVGFDRLGLHKIIVAHAQENIASESVCRKLGFQQYAHEHDAFFKDGVWHDLIWYELIKI